MSNINQLVYEATNKYDSASNTIGNVAGVGLGGLVGYAVGKHFKDLASEKVVSTHKKLIDQLDNSGIDSNDKIRARNSLVLGIQNLKKHIDKVNEYHPHKGAAIGAGLAGAALLAAHHFTKKK